MTTRESAVELLAQELRLVRRYAAGDARAPVVNPTVPADTMISLPFDAAVLILDCARQGLRKGQGRGGRRLTRYDKKHRLGIVSWAKRRKAELLAEQRRAEDRSGRRGRRPSSSADVELQAAEEASTFARERYRFVWKAATIKRLMGLSDERLMQQFDTPDDDPDD
jgi:hypothetical protein